MKHRLPVLIITLLIFATKISSQTIQRLSEANTLTITVVDMVKGFSLVGYTITIINPYDTVMVRADTMQQLVFNLDSAGHYLVTARKSGYKTVTVEWDQPREASSVLVDFYLPATSLSKKEKREGMKESTMRVRSRYSNPEYAGFQAPPDGLYIARVIVVEAPVETVHYYVEVD
jgi:hypothetical protein